MPRKGDPRTSQMEVAKGRVMEIDNTEIHGITAHSICPDKEALRNLLFAYYYVGVVRNNTNHAAEEFDGFSSIRRDSDVGERMNTIIQSIEYFIHSYDVVADLVKQSGEVADVDKITADQIIEYSKTLKPRFDNRYHRDDRIVKGEQNGSQA